MCDKKSLERLFGAGSDAGSKYLADGWEYLQGGRFGKDLSNGLEARSEFTYETGGDKVTDPAGLFDQARDRYGHRSTAKAESEANRRARALRPNAPPGAPEATAMLINPAAEIRDRRRRAILEARSRLMSPGPGANIPLG